jgi:hypothetical protein
MLLPFLHDKQCHEKGQTSLIINMHVEYGVVKCFIQLGYKFAPGR